MSDFKGRFIPRQMRRDYEVPLEQSNQLRQSLKEVCRKARFGEGSSRERL